MKSSTPTLKTIAQNLGLSIGTVQRALHDKGGYSEQTKVLVLREAARVGYIANTAASALRRSPITLGVLLPKPVERNRYFFHYLWQGIERAKEDLSIYQINLVRCYAEPGTDAFAQALEFLLNRSENPIEGLITVSRRDARVDKLMQEFARREIPVFIINSIDAPSPSAPLRYAINANHRIGALAADVFSCVHKDSKGSMLLLGGDRNNRIQTERSIDFSSRIAASCPGLNVLETHFYHDLPRLKDFIIDYLHKFDDAVGIYAVSSRETLTMCQAISECRHAAALTSIGTDTFPELLPYFENGTLTASICQYPTKQSYTAVHMLIAHITKTPQTHTAENFPIAAVFRSNASIFCSPQGLI